MPASSQSFLRRGKCLEEENTWRSDVETKVIFFRAHPKLKRRAVLARLGPEIPAPSPGPAPARAPPPGCRSLLSPRLAARWSGRGCRRALGPFGAPASHRAAPRSWVEREARVVWPVASRAGAGPQPRHRGRSRYRGRGRGAGFLPGRDLARQGVESYQPSFALLVSGFTLPGLLIQLFLLRQRPCPLRGHSSGLSYPRDGRAKRPLDRLIGAQLMTPTCDASAVGGPFPAARILCAGRVPTLSPPHRGEGSWKQVGPAVALVFGTSPYSCPIS